MVHSENRDQDPVVSMDDPIPFEDDLADCWIFKLFNDRSDFGKITKHACGFS